MYLRSKRSGNKKTKSQILKSSIAIETWVLVSVQFKTIPCLKRLFIKCVMTQCAQYSDVYEEKNREKLLKILLVKRAKIEKVGHVFFGRRGEEQGCDPIYTLVLE